MNPTTIMTKENTTPETLEGGEGVTATNAKAAKAPKAAKAVKTVKAVKAAKVAKPRGEELKRIPVSEANLRKAASRLLQQHLVSVEMQYVQRVLGNTATQQDIDDKVLAVRKMKWSSIVVPD
jgi:PhoPQ-activated pathogenicity-related protein